MPELSREEIRNISEHRVDNLEIDSFRVKYKDLQSLCQMSLQSLTRAELLRECLEFNGGQPRCYFLDTDLEQRIRANLEGE